VKSVIIVSKKSHLPLLGRKVLVTRTEEGNLRERDMLKSLGANVVELSAIEIHPPTSWNAFDDAMRTIEHFDWVIFTSRNGVKAFFERLEKIFSGKRLQTKFACVGPATQNELERFGYASSFVPSDYLTQELGRQLSKEIDLHGKRILLARAESANKELGRELERYGAIVTNAPVYRSVPVEGIPNHDILAGVTDITLASPSAVEGLLSFVSSKEVKLAKINIHCIGPVTAKRASELGLTVLSVAKVHTIDGLVMDLLKSGKE
jgi:uroporphyrinogen III methyltransferase/synthase